MSLIESIRNKTPEQKMQIIWFTVAVVAVILVALWILTSRFHNNHTPENCLFKTLGQGIQGARNGGATTTIQTNPCAKPTT